MLNTAFQPGESESLELSVLQSLYSSEIMQKNVAALFFMRDIKLNISQTFIKMWNKFNEMHCT